MLCQNALLFRFFFSPGNKETIVYICLTIEATQSSLVIVVNDAIMQIEHCYSFSPYVKDRIQRGPRIPDPNQWIPDPESSTHGISTEMAPGYDKNLWMRDSYSGFTFAGFRTGVLDSFTTSDPLLYTNTFGYDNH